MEIRIVPPLLRLYLGLLPLTLVASLTGALGSLVLLADRGQSGAFWVLLSCVFAVAGAGASVWWVIEGLLGLGSLGGL